MSRGDRELVEDAYGLPNRPSTPMRTIICGTYGNVAEFEAKSRSKDVLRQKIAEKIYRPSRNHTKASTLYSSQVKEDLFKKAKEKDFTAS